MWLVEFSRECAEGGDASTAALVDELRQPRREEAARPTESRHEPA